MYGLDSGLTNKQKSRQIIFALHKVCTNHMNIQIFLADFFQIGFFRNGQKSLQIIFAQIIKKLN